MFEIRQSAGTTAFGRFLQVYRSVVLTHSGPTIFPEAVLRKGLRSKDTTRENLTLPLSLLQRLAALVPRPRLHLIRFHGVLAPNAKLRKAVVPVPTARPGQPAAQRGAFVGRNC